MYSRSIRSSAIKSFRKGHLQKDPELSLGHVQHGLEIRTFRRGAVVKHIVVEIDQIRDIDHPVQRTIDIGRSHDDRRGTLIEHIIDQVREIADIDNLTAVAVDVPAGQ